MVAFPKRVEVGPLVYTVRTDKQRSDDADTFGFTDHEKSEIILDPKLAAPHARVILLHELLHTILRDAIGAQRGGKSALLADRDTEEILVTAVAPWLLEVLRRNPELVAYLLAT